jgi:hypothetical protein
MLSDQTRHTHFAFRQSGTTANWRYDIPRDWFETHAKWQGSIEKPAAKDFVARKVRTIKWNEVQGTSWNAIKCEEHLRSCPEAVVRQATINLDSQVWKSLGDSFPKLYCINLAEAYVMWENVSLRNFAWEEKVWFVSSQRTFAWETFGKRRNGILVLIFVPSSHKHLASRKRVMCAKNLGVHVRCGTRRTKGIKKRDENLDSCAAKKGAKKLVSSASPKTLEKESSNKD